MGIMGSVRLNARHPVLLSHLDSMSLKDRHVALQLPERDLTIKLPECLLIIMQV